MRPTTPQPPPTLRAALPVAARYTAEQAERLRAGFTPSHPEDRWLVRCVGEELTLHRALTGLCIYGFTLRPEGEGWLLAGAWVNRDPAQYTQTDLAWDAALARWLVDRLLLDDPRPFPIKEGLDPDRRLSFALTVAGRAVG